MKVIFVFTHFEESGLSICQIVPIQSNRVLAWHWFNPFHSDSFVDMCEWGDNLINANNWEIVIE